MSMVITEQHVNNRHACKTTGQYYWISVHVWSTVNINVLFGAATFLKHYPQNFNTTDIYITEETEEQTVSILNMPSPITHLWLISCFGALKSDSKGSGVYSPSGVIVDANKCVFLLTGVRKGTKPIKLHTETPYFKEATG